LDLNLGLHAERLAQASSEGVSLVVFPELSLTGYLLKDLVPEVAIPSEGLLRLLNERCTEVRGLEAVIGFVEETPGHRYHNSAAFVRWDDLGRAELVHVHRKVYLPTYGLFDEGRYFSEGRTIRSFESRFFGRCGILICEDAWHLSLPLLLAVDGPQLEGAGLLLILSNSPARGVSESAQGIPESHRTWENILKTYASLLESVVVYAHRGGVEDGLNFSGGSQVLGAGGEVLAKAELFRPATLDVDLDWPEPLRTGRIGSLVLASENVDLLQRELKRVLREAFD
jgi:predicted amidohydrolase